MAMYSTADALRDKLRRLDAIDVDEEVFLSAQARAFAAEYVTYGAEQPDWLTQGLIDLDRDIRSKQDAIIQKRLRDLKARRSAMLPREDKLKNLDAEIAALEAKRHPTV